MVSCKKLLSTHEGMYVLKKTLEGMLTFITEEKKKDQVIVDKQY